METTTTQRKCKSCGEPEMVGVKGGGDFGWADVPDEKRGNITICQRCGRNPLRAPRKTTGR